MRLFFARYVDCHAPPSQRHSYDGNNVQIAKAALTQPTQPSYGIQCNSVYKACHCCRGYSMVAPCASAAPDTRIAAAVPRHQLFIPGLMDNCHSCHQLCDSECTSAPNPCMRCAPLLAIVYHMHGALRNADDHCGGSRGSDMLQLPPTTPEAPPGRALGLPPL